jgi:hypothetical protein
MRWAIALGLCASLLAGAGGAAETELPLQELPPQTLAAGQCALVLWTRTTPARRVFMALNNPAGAKVQVDGRTVALARTGWDGEAVFGHSPKQAFAGGGWTLSVSVDFDTRSGLVGGAVAPSGTLELRDAKGWSILQSVAGMVACQS